MLPDRIDAKSSRNTVSLPLSIVKWFLYLPPFFTINLQDGIVRLYSIQGTSLKNDDKSLEAKGPVTDLAYSHDGAFLAVCDANKVVTVFSVTDGYAVRIVLSEISLFENKLTGISCLNLLW